MAPNHSLKRAVTGKPVTAARDRESQKMRNPLAQQQSRWQRFVRYVWDRKRG